MMMRPVYRYYVGLVVALGACLMAGVCHAALMVDATVQPLSGGLFHYEFTITNNTPDDVSFINLTEAPAGDLNILTTLTTPTEFLGVYDPGLSPGIVTLLEGTSPFVSGTTVSGFSFDSAFGPAAGFFSAFDAQTTAANALVGTIQIQNQVVPEPGTLTLMALGLGALVLSPLRRRMLCQR